MEQQIQEFRAFNRFYTSVIGLLDGQYLNSTFSLTEVRVLYELHHSNDGITARQLTIQLKLDKGYLSRILHRFDKEGLVFKEKTTHDGRSVLLRLSDKGRTAFEPLDEAARQQASDLLRSISADEVRELLKSMASIKAILAKSEINGHE